MNTKLAKALRKKYKYHPNQDREYETINQSNKMKIKTVKQKGTPPINVPTGERKSGTLELKAECTRSLYKEIKKEYYK